MLPLLDPYQLLFIEEPVLPDNLHMLPELRELTSTPLATGERLFGRWDFLGVLRDGISVIQPDVSDAGGISETRRIAALAEPYDVVVAPHCPLGPIALAASLQIDFATPNILIQEQSITHYGNSFFDYVLDRGVFDMRDGWFSRPTGPGLGVEIDEKAVEAAAKVGFEMPDPIRFHADGSYAEFERFANGASHLPCSFPRMLGEGAGPGASALRGQPEGNGAGEGPDPATTSATSLNHRRTGRVPGRWLHARCENAAKAD